MATVGQEDQSTGETPCIQTGRLERNNNREEVRFPSINPTRPFSSEMYQKLENPLNHFLKEIPAVDGNDASILCDFLLKALNISTISQVSEPKIYELLSPYCRGEVLACLNQAPTTRENFDLFNDRVLRHFISERHLTQLRVQNCERVQRFGEPLAVYVQSVRRSFSSAY
jgi:hypothetical protein